MAKAMKLVKTAGSNTKLECQCGRMFWHNAEREAICPDCKIKWNGIYTTDFARYWVLGMKLDGKWSLAATFEADSLQTCLLGIQANVPFMFVAEELQGMHCAEIDQSLYNELTAKLSNLNQAAGFEPDMTLHQFLKQMWEEILHGRSQRKDAHPPG